MAPSRSRLSGHELVVRVNRAFTKTMLIANTVGGLLVLVFLTLVLPVAHPPPVRTAVLLNWPAAILSLGVAAYVAPRWGRAIAAPSLQWLIEDRSPTPAEQRAVLRNPFAQLKVGAVMWAIAAVIFGAINLHSSAQLAGTVVIGILMGSVVTSAIAYLLGERAMRPVTARVLEYGVPMTPVAPGVIARTLIAWVGATVVPLIAIADVSVGMLNGDTPRTAATAWSLIFLAALALLTGTLATLITAKSMAEPIRAVRRAMGDIERGDIEVEVEVDDASEIGLLQAGFNRMAAGLRERERLQDLFGRHVGEDVARRALEAGIELGGEIREAAVMFVDVVNSTGLTATSAPHVVVTQLNAFFGLVSEVACRHGGWVNKFEGDAALCVFGVPTPMEDPAGCALAAARELARRLEAECELAAGIGVSAGSVVAGHIGTAERFEYTVIGNPVNEAARLTDLAKDQRPRVLASGAALSRAHLAEAEFWQIGEQRVLRGRLEPTVLAAPLTSGVAATSP